MASLPSSSSSRSLRHSSRVTRAPLQELPLDKFLLPPSSKHGSSAKRPVSPGTPVLYSPAKRRILNEEGLFAAKSPLSITPATASASAAPSSSKQLLKSPQNFHQQYKQTSARFSDALKGPDSPARKLDFGTPKNATGCRTPLRQSTEEKLAASPEIKASSRSHSKSCEADNDYFSIMSAFQVQPSHSQSQPQSQSQILLPSSSSSSSSSSQSHRHIDFYSAPREMLPPIDPQSEHYPGFTVYHDSHILIPRLRLTSPTPNSSLTPVDGNLQGDVDVELVDSGEPVKENLPPRRRIRNASMADTPEKAQLFSPLSATSSSVPVTPPRETSPKERDILTPRPLSIFGLGVSSGPGKAQHRFSKQDPHVMRRILEKEVDGEI